MHALPALLHRYASGAWRRRWIALAFAWLISIGGWIGVSLIPNQYEADARLYVDADAVLTPLLHGLAIDSTPSNQVELLQRTLLSRPNLEKLISKTDLDLTAPAPVERDQLIERLGTDIKIQPQTRNLFTIQYRDRNPRLAYDVIQTIINLFIENATGNNREEMQNARRFIEQQIATYEEKLREAERRRADFKAKYVDLLPSDANGGTSRLEGARSEVVKLQGDLQDAVARRDMLAADLKSANPLLVTDPGYSGGGGGGGNTDLAAAERHLQELRLRFTEEHPDVITARNLVAALKAGGAPQAAASGGGAHVPARSVPNTVYEQVKVRLLDAESVVTSLRRQIADAQKERDRLEAIARSEPGLQAEYMNMDRDYTVLRKNYEELLSRREAMRLSAAADTDADKMRLQIIDPPKMPRTPVAPKRILLMAGVLVAGLGGGLGFALLLVQLDSCFFTTQDLRNLGLPVLGGVSFLQIASPQRRQLIPAFFFGAGVVSLVAVFAIFVAGPHLPSPHWLARFV